MRGLGTQSGRSVIFKYPIRACQACQTAFRSRQEGWVKGLINILGPNTLRLFNWHGRPIGLISR